jgi:hypothetical protein
MRRTSLIPATLNLSCGARRSLLRAVCRGVSVRVCRDCTLAPGAALARANVTPCRCDLCWYRLNLMDGAAPETWGGGVGSRGVNDMFPWGNPASYRHGPLLLCFHFCVWMRLPYGYGTVYMPHFRGHCPICR